MVRPPRHASPTPVASHYEVLRSSWATLSCRAGLVAAGEGDVVLLLLTLLGTGHVKLVRTVTDDLTGLVKMGATTAALSHVYQVTGYCHRYHYCHCYHFIPVGGLLLYRYCYHYHCLSTDCYHYLYTILSLIIILVYQVTGWLVRYCLPPLYKRSSAATTSFRPPCSRAPSPPARPGRHPWASWLA